MKAEEFNEKDSAIPWNLGDLNKELSVSLIGKVRAMIRGERKMPFGKLFGEASPIKDIVLKWKEYMEDDLERLEKEHEWIMEAGEEEIMQYEETIEELEIRLERAVRSVESVADKHVFAGKIVDKESGVGLPGLTIELFLDKFMLDKSIGECTTDATGNYHLEVEEDKRIKKSMEKYDFDIKITDENQTEIDPVTSTCDRLDNNILINVSVDGTKISKTLNKGLANKKALETEIKKIQNQKDLIAFRNRIR